MISMVFVLFGNFLVTSQWIYQKVVKIFFKPTITICQSMSINSYIWYSNVNLLSKWTPESFRKKTIVYFEGTYFHSQRAHHVKSTLNWRRYYIIYSIRRRPNVDEFPRHFYVLFRCNFADQKIHVVSTYFFDVFSLIEKSTFFHLMSFRWSKNPCCFHVLLSM